MVKNEPKSSHSQPMETNPPRNFDDDVVGKPFESAGENWCNATYGVGILVPFEPSSSYGYPTLSRENMDPTPISNFNF